MGKSAKILTVFLCFILISGCNKKDNRNLGGTTTSYITSTIWETVTSQLTDDSYNDVYGSGDYEESEDSSSELTAEGPTVVESATKNTSAGVDGKDITVNLPSGKLTVVNASKFGMSPASDDNSNSFADALAYCSVYKNVKLIIDKGVYRFAGSLTATLSNATNVMIDGQGSEFIYSGKPIKGFIILENSNVVELKNITIDWDWDKERLATVAKVEAVSDNTIEFSFPELTDVPTGLKWMNLNQCDPNTFTAGAEDGKEFWETQLKFSKVEKTAANKLKVTHSGALSTLKVGEAYIIRHTLYGTDSITVTGCKNVSLKNITNYSNPGMCYKIVGGTQFYQLINCKDTIRPGTNRHISSTADALHIANTKGYGIVENCEFGYSGDDCVNIHDNNSPVTVNKKNNSTFQIRSSLPCEVGDTISVRKPDFTPMSETAKIISITPSDGAQLIKLDKELPAEVNKNYIFSNTKYNSGNVVFRNNYFHENRARGMLVQSENILVENNKFYKNQGAGMIVSVDIYDSWSEGTDVNNLVVRNNTFEKCNVNDWTATVLLCASTRTGITAYPALKNLNFTGNTFTDFPSEAFSVCSSENVTITNNIFKNPTARITNLATRGTIKIEKTQNINVSNNEWFSTPNVVNPAKITIDNAGQLTASNNVVR